MNTQSLTGVTVQLKVSNFEEGISWYEKLLRRPPDLMFLGNFAEWEVMPNVWLQIAEGTPAVGAGALRFGVMDITSERARILDDLGIEVTEIEGLEGVPAIWCNFEDPFGNRLGLYQEIAITTNT
jgi:hypothetical protein